MLSFNIPYIVLDQNFDIIEYHGDIDERLLSNGFLKSLLINYKFDDFETPIHLGSDLFAITNLSLIFAKQGDNLICAPIKNHKQSFFEAYRNVSFGLREPIFSIFAMIPIIAHNINKADFEQSISNLDVINLQSYKLLRTITNIAISSNIVEGNLPSTTDIDFSILLEDLITSVKSVVRNITFETDIEEDIFINSNRHLIKNALLNIICNSIKFKADRHTKITVKLYKDGNRAVFSYKDNSKGIKDEYLPYIFNPYFSKDPYSDDEPDPSLGIGLFIAEAIFEQAGGKLLVTSQFGEDVKYSISIPMVEDSDVFFESSVSDLLMDKYSELFIQLCDYCRLPSLQ